jgi:hypothetical protein
MKLAPEAVGIRLYTNRGFNPMLLAKDITSLGDQLP